MTITMEATFTVNTLHNVSRKSAAAAAASGCSPPEYSIDDDGAGVKSPGLSVASFGPPVMFVSAGGVVSVVSVVEGAAVAGGGESVSSSHPQLISANGVYEEQTEGVNRPALPSSSASPQVSGSPGRKVSFRDVAMYPSPQMLQVNPSGAQSQATLAMGCTTAQSAGVRRPSSPDISNTPQLTLSTPETEIFFSGDKLTLPSPQMLQVYPSGAQEHETAAAT
mmetsp:Transcript_10024/g.17932  ORF Transcript_10024/g.17932 Transcript_10024/m.17932 type:complete len:222 (-) Transcript_10024:682-1347(-)